MRPGTLYIVATPLGNLGDLSARAVETLRTVPVVAAEDTRHTRRLLSAIGASPRKLLSYHAHSDTDREETLLEILAGGEDVALVSDAGTPAVSDPGAAMVARAHATGICVVPIPGPSAVATVLSSAGFPADRYQFLGFVPRKGKDRRELLEAVATAPWSSVLFEAANRLVDLLDDLIAVAGPEREAAVGRELTKLHEEVRRGRLVELRDHYAARPPLGEVTMVVARGETRPQHLDGSDHEAAEEAIRAWLAAGESRRAVVRKVMEQFGIARNDAYRLVMDA